MKNSKLRNYLTSAAIVTGLASTTPKLVTAQDTPQRDSALNTEQVVTKYGDSTMLNFLTDPALASVREQLDYGSGGHVFDSNRNPNAFWKEIASVSPIAREAMGKLTLKECLAPSKKELVYQEDNQEGAEIRALTKYIERKATKAIADMASQGKSLADAVQTDPMLSCYVYSKIWNQKAQYYQAFENPALPKGVLEAMKTVPLKECFNEETGEFKSRKAFINATAPILMETTLKELYKNSAPAFEHDFIYNLLNYVHSSTNDSHAKMLMTWTFCNTGICIMTPAPVHITRATNDFRIKDIADVVDGEIKVDPEKVRAMNKTLETTFEKEHKKRSRRGHDFREREENRADEQQAGSRGF